MGAAPVLIMLAAVGVDYGWQPDGTTSSRGDNIEYIVQISPDQLQQIRSIGEITSSIDPSVQGRVSRIVVRVGNSPLPKIAGRSTAQTNLPTGSATSVNGDQDAIPQPELRDSIATTTTTSDESRVRMTESLMKPDPQGTGGFALPESLQTSASSAFDQVKNSTNEAATQFGAQVRSAFEDQANALGQTATDAATLTTDSLQNSFATPVSPITGSPTAAPVPTVPMAARDDRWNTLSTQTTSTAVQGPSTDPVAANARTAPWSAAATPSATSSTLAAPSLQTPGYATPPFATPPFATPGLSTPNPTTDPRSLTPAFGSPTTDYRNPAAAPSVTASSNVPPRDATDPAWSGYGTTTNFGSVPGGLSVPQTGLNSSPTAPTSSAVANATIGNSRATGNSQFWKDSSGNWRNAKNQLVNSDGHPVDIYGRPVDENNHLLPDNRVAQTNDSRASSSTSILAPPHTGLATNPIGKTSPFDQSAHGHPASSQSPFHTNPTSAQLAQQRTEQQLIEAQRELLLLKEREKAQTRLINFDHESASASDRQLTASQLAAKAERDRIEAAAAAAALKPKSVAAQPFFNFVLLISLVGNFYLIYETSNLRRKFRSMISSVRSSKVIAQPATN